MLDERVGQMMIALQPKLRRFAYGLTGDLDSANELVQCTYERALSRIGQWQVETRLDSWLYRILQSIWFNQLRGARVRGQHLPSVESESLGSDVAERQLEAGMMLESVQHAIWCLPEEQRAALLIVVVEGLSYKEASEVLDIPVGTLTSRLARARSALTDWMNQGPETKNTKVTK